LGYHHHHLSTCTGQCAVSQHTGLIGHSSHQTCHIRLAGGACPQPQHSTLFFASTGTISGTLASAPVRDVQSHICVVQDEMPSPGQCSLEAQCQSQNTASCQHWSQIRASTHLLFCNSSESLCHVNKILMGQGMERGNAPEFPLSISWPV
jgi:hypothetical protein